MTTANQKPPIDSLSSEDSLSTNSDQDDQEMKNVAVVSQVKKKIYFKSQKTMLASLDAIDSKTPPESFFEGLVCHNFFKSPKFDITCSVFKNVKFLKDETE